MDLETPIKMDFVFKPEKNVCRHFALIYSLVCPLHPSCQLFSLLFFCWCSPFCPRWQDSLQPRARAMQMWLSITGQRVWVCVWSQSLCGSHNVGTLLQELPLRWLPFFLSPAVECPFPGSLYAFVPNCYVGPKLRSARKLYDKPRICILKSIFKKRK